MSLPFPIGLISRCRQKCEPNAVLRCTRPKQFSKNTPPRPCNLAWCDKDLVKRYHIDPTAIRSNAAYEFTCPCCKDDCHASACESTYRARADRRSEKERAGTITVSVIGATGLMIAFLQSLAQRVRRRARQRRVRKRRRKSFRRPMRRVYRTSRSFPSYRLMPRFP